MVEGDEDPGTVFDRYHGANFVLRNDGTAYDRNALVAHARPVRRNVSRISVEVHQTVIQEDQVAARYTTTALMRQGRTAVTDVYLFGQLAPDGRLAWAEQVTRIPADLASADSPAGS